MSVHTISKTRLSLNVIAEDTHVGISETCGSVEYSDFTYFELDSDMVIVDGGVYMFCRTIDKNEDAGGLTAVKYAYTEGFCPGSVSQYMSAALLGSIPNLNRWLVKSGVVWFYCRRLQNYRVQSFYLDERVTVPPKADISMVIDVEVMVGFLDILIDILMAGALTLSPHDRSVDWMLEKMEAISVVEPCLRTVYVRPFFSKLCPLLVSLRESPL